MDTYISRNQRNRRHLTLLLQFWFDFFGKLPLKSFGFIAYFAGLNFSYANTICRHSKTGTSDAFPRILIVCISFLFLAIIFFNGGFSHQLSKREKASCKAPLVVYDVLRKSDESTPRDFSKEHRKLTYWKLSFSHLFLSFLGGFWKKPTKSQTSFDFSIFSFAWLVKRINIHNVIVVGCSFERARWKKGVVFIAECWVGLDRLHPVAVPRRVHSLCPSSRCQTEPLFVYLQAKTNSQEKSAIF